VLRTARRLGEQKGRSPTSKNGGKKEWTCSESASDGEVEQNCVSERRRSLTHLRRTSNHLVDEDEANCCESHNSLESSNCEGGGISLSPVKKGTRASWRGGACK